MADKAAFDKTKPNKSNLGSPAGLQNKMNATSSGSSVKHANSRGVEHPIAEDMALIGDTRHVLHHKSMPRKTGPNYGADTTPAPGPDHFRVDCGEGVDGEL